jgi:OmpA-OmpF porin, OOP family
MRSQALVVSVAFVVGALASPGGARADGFDAERFVPSAGAAGGFVVEHPVVPFHFGLGLGLFLNFADDPVVERDTGTGEILARPVDTSLSADLLASLGLFGFAELAIHLPVHLIYDGDEGAMAGGSALSARGGVGDLRLVPKVRLWSAGTEERHALVGFALPVTLPTGDEEAFRGAGGVTVEPRVLFAAHGERLGLGINAGFRWRSERPQGLPWGNEITFAVMGSYELVPESIEVRIELFGGKHVSTDADGPRLPLEGILGLIYRPARAWSLYAGAGAGLSSALGEPDFRLIAGVRYASALPLRHGFGDSDGDGIPDKDDQCPYEPEDFDGWQDEDGCPDPDNDGDGIPDEIDQCPDIPEEPGGSGDGCPSATYVKIVDGQFVIFGKILFKTGSADVDPSSENLLDQIAVALEGNQQVRRVRIEGHTDNVGGAAVNQRLSEQRAASVKRALVKRGVAERRLEATGFGQTRPAVPNSSPAGRAKNRRVEFIIVE